MRKSGASREAGKGKRSTASKTKVPRAAAKPTPLSGPNPRNAEVAASVMHEVPADLREILTSDADLLARWNDLTPIQRNEWICWITIVKKPETRADHVRRMRSELREGERQPCCWPGCPHRRPKAKKWFRDQ
jgi:type II secretory pathway component PulC